MGRSFGNGEKKFNYVYLITVLTENGEKYYIGKRSCNCPIEKDTYLGSGTLIKRAVKKYGKNKVTKAIICICETEKEVFEKEKYYIGLFNACKDKNFYNIADGGQGAIFLETRRKISEANIGKTIPDYQKEILSDIHKRKIICINTKQIYNGIEEVPKEIRNSHINQCCRGVRTYCGTLPETGEKLMWAYVNENGEFDYPEIPSFDRKINDFTYICLTTGKHYKSIGDASKDTKCNRNSIRDCCQGKQKTTYSKNGKKLQWQYSERDEGTLQNNKKVLCITTKEIFDSIRIASRITNTATTSISGCCTGRLKTAGKHPITKEPLQWKHYTEQ